ncbi:MAG: tRNA dihydrouridine synthase DusB [Betaproteobacteria bacterium]|nr:tRNA dihydrouridine synthase DusB [Betaproteobacteria bacterium]
MQEQSKSNKNLFFSEPLQVGKLRVKNRVLLAPLAGVSDVPFRRVCQEQGAGLTYVEMLSATAIRYKNKRTFEMMVRHPSENLLGVQVTGSSAEDVAIAIEQLDALGFDTIDINMGCPVKKVTSAGCGSAILKDPHRVEKTVRLARQSTSLPLSAKIRLGFTREDVNVTDTVSRITLSAADMVTIHGRTRSESYSTPVDCSGVRLGIQSAISSACNSARPIPVTIGNGDIFDIGSARRMREETGCDGIMVSRGALGNPWVFREILEEQTYNPTFAEWHDLVLRHLDYHQAHCGNTPTAAALMRKHLLWYAKGYPGIKALRDTLNRIESLDVAREILKNFATTLAPETPRFVWCDVDGNANKYMYDPKYEMDRQLDRGVGDEDLTPATQEG